jgi:hypothetical protein
LPDLPNDAFQTDVPNAKGFIMITSVNGVINVVLALAFLVASGYAIGRIHQSKRHEADRDDSFRQGYNQAARALFDVARRAARGTAVTTRDLHQVGGHRRRIEPGAIRTVRPGRRS